MNPLNVKMESVLDELAKSDQDAYTLVDRQVPCPDVYRGNGLIKLIILGQDPTINRPPRDGEIRMVLKLDSRGPLRAYIKGICNHLGVDFADSLYATNLFKNFFTEPPVQLAKARAPWLFEKFRDLWLPFLKEELAKFPDVPVITLGEPILKVLARQEEPHLVRDYWGYTPDWKTGKTVPFTYLKAQANLLERDIFPFPHTTSARTKKFYSGRLVSYLQYVKQIINR